MVKIEATFPKRDNEGNLFRSSSFLAVEAYLLEVAGGYTVTECSGGWKDDEKVYIDYSFVYCVVVDDMKAHLIMTNLKRMILNDFRQHSAWITYHDINIF